MKILFIGDIVGKPGRRAVSEFVPSLIAEKKIDLVIANCENAAAGFGVTREIVEELYGSHIDVLTSGNHIWNKKEVLEFIGDYETLLRPANYPATTPGSGAVLIPTATGEYVGVLNLAGRIFMQPIDLSFCDGKKQNCRVEIENKKSLLWIFMPKQLPKKKLWAGILMAKFPPFWERILTCRRRMKKYCHKELPTSATWA